MNIKLILFDLDGTLIDSKPDIVIAVNRALIQCGLGSREPEAVGRCIGYGITYLFQKLLGGDVPETTLNQLIETYRQFYREKMSVHSRVYPGIPEALHHFRIIPRAVLTNKTQLFAEQILRELEIAHLFSAVYGGDAFAKQKPDPFPIQEICRHFQIQPKDCVMVGDSEVDLASAKGAGARSVIVKYGYGNQQAIAELGPDHQISEALELKDLFANP